MTAPTQRLGRSAGRVLVVALSVRRRRDARGERDDEEFERRRVRLLDGGGG